MVHLLVLSFIPAHGSYLQGMETKAGKVYYVEGYVSTDPTYKEWKLMLALARLVSAMLARILPTRNGNEFHCGKYGLERSACTDPTYKEWKLLYGVMWKKIEGEHGSYLQGMETISLL